jgi:hypothetical protein
MDLDHIINNLLENFRNLCCKSFKIHFPEDNLSDNMKRWLQNTMGEELDFRPGSVPVPKPEMGQCVVRLSCCRDATFGYVSRIRT